MKCGLTQRIACLLALVAACALARAQTVPSEYEVKTSFLFNFIQFVEWPGDVLDYEDSLTLCVVGAERFGPSLNALGAERVKGHDVVIRRLEVATQAGRSECHLLFVASAPGDPPIDVRPQRGLLIVGESPGFLKRGAVINLVDVQGRIRFEINPTAAEQAGLTVSSRLLRLAVK